MFCVIEDSAITLLYETDDGKLHSFYVKFCYFSNKNLFKN